MPKSTDFSFPLQDAVTYFATPLDWIRGATSHFEAAQLTYGQGWDNAWDEACALVQTTLHLTPEELRHAANTTLLPGERQQLAQRIQERIQARRPLAYILGKAAFGPFFIDVDERVLIPRSPFAEWIGKQFEPFLPREPHRILELCTGSGCIALYLAAVFPEAAIDASDISEAALAVAHHNICQYDMADRIRLVASDLWEAIPAEPVYDLIVANPPYVPLAEYQALAPEFYHEPRLALEAGSDGLACIHTLIAGAAARLSPEGLLVIEMGQSHAAFANTYPDLPYFELACETGGDGLVAFTREALLRFPGK